MKISIAIVAYNSAGHIGRCLNSLLCQKYADKEVIVVDNGSADKTSEIVRAIYPEALLISNSYNAGAAEARNQAISRAKGEWILTLDADAYLGEDFLLILDRFLKTQGTETRLGIVIPKIYYPQSKVFYAAGHRLTFLRRFYDVGRAKADRGQFDGLKEIFGACSAVALYRKAMLEEVKTGKGYFDKDLFYMVEDVDLSWRARKKGWRAFFCAAALSYHSGDGAALGEEQKKFYSIRNRFIMMAKNDSRAHLALMALPMVFYEVLRFCYLFLKGESKIYLKAIASARRYS